MMLFDAEFEPYPIQDEIDSCEDGVGYALRMATCNGITFDALARRLASPGHIYLPHSSARALALMFGCSSSGLERAFVHRVFHGGATYAEYIGRLFTRPYHVRQTHPQVCSQCLAENRVCAALWSIALCTCCPHHRIRLLDRCRCGRLISWRRPSIDVCECGSLLTADSQIPDGADTREIEVSMYIEHLLAGDHFSLTAPLNALSPLCSLSLDAFLRTVWAFGVLPNDAAAIHPRAPNRILNTDVAASVVCRAHDRLSRALSASHGGFRDAVYVNALLSIYEDYVSATDLALLNTLLTRISSPTKAIARRVNRNLSRQLTLF